MSRSRFLAAAALLALAAPASAQTTMTRPVHAGEVTGLELSIDGAQHAPRGGRLRFLLAVHEVVGLSDLRPAAHAHVRVLSSLVRDHAVAEATSDALGRAEVSVDVPADAPAAFHVVFEALSSRNVRRQFELDVRADPALTVVLETDRQSVRAHQPVHAWGRVVSAATHQPVAGAPVRLQLTDARGRPSSALVVLHTDRAGAFAATVPLPGRAPASFTLDARVGEGEPQFQTDAQTPLAIARSEAPAVIVRAAPRTWIAAPGDSVAIDVVVRTADGRPVRGATVTSPQIPAPPAGVRATPLRTDARGRASFAFIAPSSVAAGVQAIGVQVNATRAGVGTGAASTAFRVARDALFAAVAVEGAALVPGLPGRIYVRVVRADGAPAGAGVEVALTGSRFGQGATARTDEDGAAVLEAPLSAAPAATRGTNGAGNSQADERCGGTTATGFALGLTRGGEHGSASGCLAVDPDSTVRVRVTGSPVVAAGATLHVELTRAPGVAALPVEVALLSRAPGALTPVTAHIVPANARTVDLVIPADVVGPVVVRARPLHGAVALAVRGGVTAVWSVAGPRFSVTARGERSGADVLVETRARANESPDVEGNVVVLPREEGDALLARIRARGDASPLGDLRVEPGDAGDALVAGALAAMVVVDDGAPAVLRAGIVVPTPAPEDPTTRGTLRDPWRARARFVEGRLALVFNLVEHHVAASLPARRDDVAVRSAAGRWEFNREMLDAIAGDAEDRGPRALGGAPLDIATLQRLDGAFTYDNVARRLTRRRMFAVLVALRHFVNEHALDLRWSWRGDPSSWLRSLVDNGVADDAGNVLSATDMVDGWGTPFALRAAPGGRARFAFLAPVPGFELVAAGPDERFGSADDVVNPFARVLPSGGAYARAVDEDGLLARLAGVELGRATIGRLASVFSVESPDAVAGADDAGSSPGAITQWTDLPARAEPDAHALDLVRPGLAADARSTLATLRSAQNSSFRAPTGVDDEPRTYAVVVDAFSAQGGAASALAHFTAGTPLLLTLPLVPTDDDARLAPRMRAGEPLVVEGSVTNLGDAAQTYTLVPRTTGGLSVQGPSTLRVAPGEAASFELALRADRVGPAQLVLETRSDQGALLRTVRAPLEVDDGSLALREDDATLVRPGRDAQLVARAGGGVTTARLVIDAPGALADDPELDRVRALDPALVAWAYALASRELTAGLAASLYSAQVPSGALPLAATEAGDGQGGQVVGASTALSTACALVAWSAAGDDDVRAVQAREAASSALGALRGTMGDVDPSAGTLRESAAVLAALATGSQGAEDDVEPGAPVDPVAQLTGRLRAQLRGALAQWRAQPTLLARAAAALLLADPSDSRGVALYEAARQAVVPDRAHAGESIVRPGTSRGGDGEVLAATAALAIAAQQRGDATPAHALGLALARRAHLAMRLGGETTFWLLAASSYGVYGLGAPDAADVTLDGHRTRVALRDGHAVLPVAHATREVHATVALPGRGSADASLFARLELLHRRAYDGRVHGALALALVGDPGYAGEVAAMELTVHNRTDNPVTRAVVELELPAGAALDAAALDALRARPHVVSVESRPGALVRVVLDTLAGGAGVELPLAVRWLARGRLTGFAAAAYLEDSPGLISTLAPSTIDLHPRPADE